MTNKRLFTFIALVGLAIIWLLLPMIPNVTITVEMQSTASFFLALIALPVIGLDAFYDYINVFRSGKSKEDIFKELLELLSKEGFLTANPSGKTNSDSDNPQN